MYFQNIKQLLNVGNIIQTPYKYINSWNMYKSQIMWTTSMYMLIDAQKYIKIFFFQKILVFKIYQFTNFNSYTK